MLKTTTLQRVAPARAAVLSGAAILTAAEEETSAAALLDHHHVRAFATGDIEAMLADYTEDSVFQSEAACSNQDRG